MSDPLFILEEADEGRMLVVTGPWSTAAAKALSRGEADGLTLNYARGFSGRDLEFLDAQLGVRRLHLLDRGITDLEPLSRLAGSLEELSVQASERAELDFSALRGVRSVAGEWRLIGRTLGELHDLESVITWRFDEVDLHAFRDHVVLQRLTIKEAPFLETLSGISGLSDLAELGVLLARRLRDISEVSELGASLRRLEFQACPALGAIDEIEPLDNLQFFGFSDCGDLESLAPLGALTRLEVLYAWGSTRVLDGNLDPLAALPCLRELRMRDRRSYSPRVADLPAAQF
jgi:internalin A